MSQTAIVGGPTRIYCDLGISDFNLETSFIVETVEAGKNGEAKIIFSDADKSEHYRIDFIGGPSICRITARSFAFYAPLRVATGSQYKVKLTMRNNLVSVRVNDMPVFQQTPVGQ